MTIMWHIFAVFLAAQTHLVVAGELVSHIKKKDIASALLSIEAYKNISDLNMLEQGLSPLHYAIKYNLYDVVSHLLSKGIDADILSSKQETPALMALRLGRYDILKLLLEKDAQFNNTKLLAYLTLKQPEENELKLDPDHYFFSALNLLLAHEDARSLLPFIYPLFALDEELFLALYKLIKSNQKPAWQVSQVLYALAHANFPHGLPSHLGLSWLTKLLDEMNASSKLRYTIWTTLKKKRDIFMHHRKHGIMQLGFKSPKDFKNSIDQLDGKTLAKSLTYYQSQVIKQLSMEDIRYLLYAPKAAKTNFLEHFTIIENIIAYLIVSETDEKIRLKRLAILADMAHELISCHNFWGAQQVLSGLTKQSVKRLFNDVDFETTTPKLKSVSVIFDPENQKEYRDALAALKDNEPRIYLIQSMLSTLINTYKSRPAGKDSEQKIAWFISLGENIKRIHDAQQKLQYRVFLNTPKRIFNGLINVPDEILIEYSHLRMPWSNFIKRELPETPMNTWGVMDLYSCIEHRGDPLMAQKLLEGGIWNGKNLNQLIDLVEKKSDMPDFGQLSKELKEIFLSH